MGDLLGSGSGVVLARFENGRESGFVDWEAVVVSEARDEVVFLHFAGAEIGDGGDGVFLDDFVCGFAADSGFDCFHHEGGGHEEGEVVVVLRGDHSFVGIHLRNDGEEGLEEAIDGEEGVRKHHAADDGAGDVAFIPLIAGEATSHGEVAFEYGVEAVDALAGAGVHLVRHRAGTGLTGCEAFGCRLVTSHEAESLAERARRGAEVGEGAHGREIEAARVNLADVDVEIGDAEVGHDASFEVDYFGSVAIEQRNGVHLGANGSLEAADLVVRDEVLERGISTVEFFPEHRDALAEGGGLSRDVVRSGGDDEILPLLGTLTEAGEGSDGFVPDDQKGAEDLELFYVLGEIARSHPFVDVLVAGEVVELLDTSFDIVTRDALALGDGWEVDLVDDGLVSGDGVGGDVETEVVLGLHDRDPELTLKDDASFGGPDVGDSGRGVAFGEDVLDHLMRKILNLGK